MNEWINKWLNEYSENVKLIDTMVQNNFSKVCSVFYENNNIG